MFTIKEYNKKLNQSYDYKANYLKWSEYRASLCKHYHKYTENINELLLVGAGHLNDICMMDVAKNSTNLAFLDVDIDSVKEGLSRFKFDKQVFNFFEQDLTGLDKDNFFEKIIFMLQADDLNGIKRYFNDVTIPIADIKLKNTYEGMIISSIYTQLLLPQYVYLVGELIEKEQFNTYLEPFMTYISKVIRKVNEMLLTYVNDEGVIICFSDILEFDSNDEFYIKMKQKINDYDYIEKYYHNYNQEYGHGLGSFGISDMSDKIHIVEQSWHIWPFNEQRDLLVKLVIGKKRSDI